MAEDKDPVAAGTQLPDSSAANVPKPLSAAAARALAEAAERRAARERAQAPTEIAGRGGLDPARYGDWEVKGIASDF
jgi:hypothetical protein